jgi:DNA polymerase delta subunit 1
LTQNKHTSDWYRCSDLASPKEASPSAIQQNAIMPAATLPQKRVLGDTGSSRRNVPSSPSSKKRRLEPLSSSPASRINSSQPGPASKFGATQTKSTFESEVLEKLSQDISDLKQSNSEKDQAWERPPVVGFDPNRDNLVFQQIEAEEGTLHGGKATVKLFGVTENGHSVMLHVTDFKHYLYLAAPVSFQNKDCQDFKVYLEAQMAQHQPVIASCQLVLRENIYGYQGNTQSPYIKVSVMDPKFINRVRTTIEKGDANWKGLWKGADGGIMTFDSLQYVLRFMVDNKVRCPTLWSVGPLADRYRSPACRG